MEASLASGGTSAGSNPGELAPLGTWAWYTLTVESTRVLLALDNGTRTGVTVPYAADFGRAASTDVGIVQAAPTTAGIRFWIDDIAMPR